MILIACGLQREAAILSGKGVLAIPGGGDATRLEAALEARAADAAVLLSCGIGGALDPTLAIGDIVIADHVIGHGDTSAPLTARLVGSLPGARLGALLGSDHIWATVDEKATMFRGTYALAADMESHIAARVAARHGLPFAAIRTISDTASETLPPAALVGMNPDGSMALGKVLLSLARRPAQLPALIRTGRSAEAAFTALKKLRSALAALLDQGSV